MIGIFFQLVVLFLVIIDPLASFLVFLTATSSLPRAEQRKIAYEAILVASGLSALVIVMGHGLLELFNTTIDEFRIAGGAILFILGIKMAMGLPLMNVEDVRNNTGRGISAIIATPLITGPATIITIIVSVTDYGALVTAGALGVVLLFTSSLLLFAHSIRKVFGKESIQVMSTLLGLITVTWGVKFVILGIKNLF